MSVNKAIVDKIRYSSRSLVRQLGFMGGRFAGTELSPSAVHALIEIDKNCLTAGELGLLLCLEKSSISRMLRKLKEQNYVIEQIKAGDSRAKTLSLTATGKIRVDEINQFGERQVRDAMSNLTAFEQEQVTAGLQLYSVALEGISPSKLEQKVEIVEGYQPTLIGKVTQLHSEYYARESGFGQHFESVVASGLAEFSGRLTHPTNKIWLALIDGEIVGSIAIDGEDLNASIDTALELNLEGERAKVIGHLRWFIISDSARGSGLGNKLLDVALKFADQCGFSETHLWTFSGLDAAKHLYGKKGFELTTQKLGSQWGNEVLEQCFVRKLVD